MATPLSSLNSNTIPSPLPKRIETKLAAEDYVEAEKDFRLFLMGLGRQDNTRLSDEEMKTVVTTGIELLTKGGDETFPLLLRSLLESLTHFPHFYEEQITLARLAAERALAKASHHPLNKENPLSNPKLPFYTEAMCYYGKALSIAHQYHLETGSLYLQASKLFMFVINDHLVPTFQDRLERAQGSGDLTRFQTILDEITLLKKYRCSQDDHQIILSLYEQAKKVLLQLQERGKETAPFAPFAQLINQGLEEPYIPQETPTATETYRTALHTFRKTFEDKRKGLLPENVKTFQEEIHQEFLTFFNLLLQDAFAILGPPPCTYDFRACGSLGRKELCPYSDLEWIILIEDPKYAPYFKTLASIINLQIVSLGETAASNLPVFSALGSKNSSGFHVDTGCNPTLDDLIGTPKTLAHLQKPPADANISDALPTLPFHSLRKTSSLKTTNSRLFETYTQEMNTLLDQDNLRQTRAIGLLKYRLSDYKTSFDPSWDQTPTLDVKKQFVELLNHPLHDLALYFNSPETNTLDLLETLSFFTPESRPLLREAISGIYLLRTRLHLQYKEQKETAYQTPQENEEHLALLAQEKFLLQKIHSLILYPLYAFLSETLSQNTPTLTPIDLLTLAFKHSSKKGPHAKQTLFHLGKHLLTQEKNKLNDHLPYYQKLSEQNEEPLREAYLEGIQEEKTLVSSLTPLPNSHGKRQLEKIERDLLSQTLASLTTSQEDKWNGLSVVMTSPALKKLNAFPYLRKDLLKEILTPTGEIKQAYAKSTQNNVASYQVFPYALHFKQQPKDPATQSPFHPGKEQAISRLMMRLFGHGVSLSELVSFTVYSQGKKIQDYLVLISKTVPGPTLKNTSLPTLDPQKLSNHFLSIPLILPGDAREVNFILSDKELVSIDNDVAFIKPVINTSWTGAPKLRCQLYTILFSYFPNLILHPASIQSFLNLKPDLLLSDWLQEMIQWNKDHAAFFKRFEKLPHFTPLFQFEKGTGAQLLTQFYKLQHFLRTHPQKEIPALDLLKTIISFDQGHTTDVGNFLYTEYLTVQNPNSLKEITGRDGSKSISMTLSNGQSFQYLPKTKQEQTSYLPEKALEEVNHFVALHFQNQAFILDQRENTLSKLYKGFSCDPPIPKQTQAILLDALLVHTYDHLNLSHCAALTNTHLLKFLQKSGPTLRHLDLRHCPEITDEILSPLTKCPHLEELYLSHCPKLTQLDTLNTFLGLRVKGPPLHFPILKTLHLSHNNALTTLNLNAPHLTTLKIDHNPTLTQVSLEAPHCKILSENSPSLQITWGVASLEVQQQQQLIEKITFGQKKWEIYFGSVDSEPPLPPSLHEILNRPCTFWPDKKVHETHLLVLIPETVNGKPFHLDYLSELIQSPKSGSKTKYSYYNDYTKKELGTKSLTSHWVLMTKDVIPESRNKSYDDQKALVQKHAKESGIPYELPKTLEAATVILMHHVETGQRIYSDSPLTYTRCQEKVNNNQWPQAIGGFAAGGLDIFYHYLDVCENDGCGGVWNVPLRHIGH